jgi:dCMP deaminase
MNPFSYIENHKEMIDKLNIQDWMENHFKPLFEEFMTEGNNMPIHDALTQILRAPEPGDLSIKSGIKNLQDIYAEDAKNLQKWDRRFLEHAEHIAQWSKDPSRKVGSLIVRPDRTIVAQGYNGFARGVNDTPERYEKREIKYEMVVHAEVNAIITSREALQGCTLYSTLLPCSRCAAIIINSGIQRVVTWESEFNVNDYAHVFALTYDQFTEAQVQLVQLPRLQSTSE